MIPLFECGHQGGRLPHLSRANHHPTRSSLTSVSQPLTLLSACTLPDPHIMHAVCAMAQIHFLMPCHSTPFHSHIHLPVVMWFPDCSPPHFRCQARHFSCKHYCKRDAELCHKHALLAPLRSESDRLRADPLAFVTTRYGHYRGNGDHNNDTHDKTMVLSSAQVMQLSQSLPNMKVQSQL